MKIPSLLKHPQSLGQQMERHPRQRTNKLPLSTIESSVKLKTVCVE